MGRQQRDAARVAVDALGLEVLDGAEIRIHVGPRHVKRVQHELVHEPVAQNLEPIAVVELRRSAPHVDFSIA